ncbi:MAG: CCA tRNA nucleotidyltransferase [Bacteroidaceae bacterium]|nr:CCA tRNA nucleotidyltransferase [Bacteroidaceae bacterium]
MRELTREDFIHELDHTIFHRIGDTADELGVECYVVGGYVRDLFLERPSKDIDVVVVGSGIEVAKALAKKLGRSAHLSVFRNFGTAQVKYHQTEVEFVGARKESYSHDSRKPIVEDGTLEDDQNRRDFTINAMAICLNKERFGELVDPFDGVWDLRDRLIATPLDPDITFSDDPLRMMRCIRFATQLNFMIEQETEEALFTNKERIQIISKERIADEMNKIMLSPAPSIGFELLFSCGLLKLIFPELFALYGVEKVNGRAHKDNFFHTLEVLDNVAKATQDWDDKERKLWIRWAALLHDIGKPKSKRWEPSIGWTFHNHNAIGEKMVADIFRNLKLPLNEKMKYVQKLVSLHMRPIAIADDIVTDSAVRRLLFEAGDDIDDLMTLCEADITSKNEVKKQRFLDNFKLVRKKLVDLEEKDRIRNFQPPVDGKEIMAVLGLSPCSQIGEIKETIKDAILDGKIPNEHDAAYQLMLEKAASMNLYPIYKDTDN